MFYLGSQMTFIEVPLGLMELPLIAGDIPQLVPLAVLCETANQTHRSQSTL